MLGEQLCYQTGPADKSLYAHLSVAQEIAMARDGGIQPREL